MWQPYLEGRMIPPLKSQAQVTKSEGEPLRETRVEVRRPKVVRPQLKSCRLLAGRRGRLCGFSSVH